MTPQEYLAKCAELEKQKSELDAAYISEHAPYKVGDRVKIIQGKSETVAEVFGLKITWSGKVEPMFYKVKKDGTVSYIRAYVWMNCKIEKL